MATSTCPICASDPNTHVLRRVADKASHSVYYTHPSKVQKDHPADHIIQHYAHRLQEKGAKSWVWVFDGSQFDTDHIMELRTGQGIAELLQGIHGDTLREINIINPTVHLKVLLKVIRPFIADPLLAKLHVLDDRPRSVLEFL